MIAKKLTKTEREWINKLQAVLDECPSDRLGAYTVGDPDLSIYDTRFETKINHILDKGDTDFCQAVDEVGAGLVDLKMPFNVHSTAG